MNTSGSRSHEQPNSSSREQTDAGAAADAENDVNLDSEEYHTAPDDISLDHEADAMEVAPVAAAGMDDLHLVDDPFVDAVEDPDDVEPDVMPAEEVLQDDNELLVEEIDGAQLLPVIFANHHGNHLDEDDDDDEEEEEDSSDEDEAHSETSQSTNEDSDEPARIITFDQSAPSTHRYLGDDMQEVHGRVIYDEGSEVKLMAFLQHSVILIPGQTVPVTAFRPNIVAMLRTVVEQQKTFAVLHINPVDGQSLASIGTTAQVLSISSEPDNSASHDLPTIKAVTVGRQRFELIDVSRMLDGLLMAKVKILPEIQLRDPIEGAIPMSHNRPRTKFHGCHAMKRTQKKRIVRVHNSCAYFTAWSDWVYRQYLPEELMIRVKQELSKWGGLAHSDLDTITSIDQMSYWLAANLPLADKDKLELLELDCSVQRIRKELLLMQKFVSLCCRICNIAIAKKSDVFSLSYEGPMGSYVNPQGYIHETMTVYKAKNLSLIGRPSTEYSWFPGYAWTIINCRRCGNHKGWKFTATSTQLKPSSFYGLTRAGVMPGIDPNNLTEQQQ